MPIGLSKRQLVWLIAGLIVLLSSLGALFIFKPWKSQATEEASGAFEIADFSHREFEGAPALALSFTHVMDARRHYDDQIQVFEMPPRQGEKARKNDGNNDEESSEVVVGNTEISSQPKDVETTGGQLVKGTWVLADNPRILYFPHVKPQTRYVVRVAPTLSSRQGKALNAEARYSVLTAAVSPAYYFASRGMVLPAV